jgi:hypothetical protein
LWMIYTGKKRWLAVLAALAAFLLIECDWS